MTDTTIDATGEINSVQRGVVWIDTLIGYAFYQQSEAMVCKKTIDGGITWGSEIDLEGTAGTTSFLTFSVWYDKWTRGFTANSYIHIFWWDNSGGSFDNGWYQRLDPSDDSLLHSPSALAVNGSNNQGTGTSPVVVSVTRARGGNIYLASKIANSGTTSWRFQRSTDGGSTFVNRIHPNNSSIAQFPVHQVLLPGEEADDQDVYLVGVVSGDVVLLANDDSANDWVDLGDILVTASWEEESGRPFGSISACMRDSDGHVLVVVHDKILGTGGATFGDLGDIRVFDVDPAGFTSTELTSPKTNTDSMRNFYIAVDQANDDIFITFSDRIAANDDRVHGFQSEDDGTTWNAEVEFTDDDPVGVPFGSIPASLLATGNRVQPTWRGASVATNSSHAILTGNVDGVGFFVDVDEDGTFSQEIIGIKSASWERGNPGELGNTPGGTLEVVVDDDTGVWDQASNALDFGGSAVVRTRMPCYLTINFDGTTYRMFTGFIHKIIPHAAHQQRDIYILCDDGSARLGRTPVNTPTDASSPFTTVIRHNVKWGSDPAGGADYPIKDILDAVGWASGARTLDEGQDLLQWWWGEGGNALDLLYEIENQERSRVYIDESGNFVYEDRSHRYKDGSGGADDHTQFQHEFDDNMADFAFAIDENTVINEAEVTVHNRAIQPITVDNAKVYFGEAPILINHGETRVIRVVPTQNIIVALAPDANDDYRANTKPDGSGTDITADITVTMEVSSKFIEFTIANANAKNAYIIHGDLSTDDEPEILTVLASFINDDSQSTIAENASSKTVHGVSGIGVDLKYQTNINDAKALADRLVDRFEDPVPNQITMSLQNKNATLYEQILTRKISDRIRANVDYLNIVDGDYFINHMRHEFDRHTATHKATYTLEAVDPTAFWLLGVTGFGELGTTTVLGF